MTEENTAALTVNSRDLHNAVKNILLFTSKDEFLPVLNAAHFKVKNNNFIVEATDRYRLGQIMVTRDIGLEDSRIGLLSNKHLKALEMMLRESAKYQRDTIQVNLEFTSNSLRVIVDFNVTTTMSYPLVDENSEFPKIDSLFPNEIVSAEDGHSGMSVNPRYLKDMATLRDWRDKPHDNKLHFQSAKYGKPIFFVATSSQGTWAQAILQPIRNDNDPVTLVNTF